MPTSATVITTLMHRQVNSLVEHTLIALKMTESLSIVQLPAQFMTVRVLFGLFLETSKFNIVCFQVVCFQHAPSAAPVLNLNFLTCCAIISVATKFVKCIFLVSVPKLCRYATNCLTVIPDPKLTQLWHPSTNLRQFMQFRVSFGGLNT